MEDELKPPPEWIVKTVETARKLYGVDDPVWQVDIIVDTDPGGDNNNRGHCTTQPYNHNVLLVFNESMKEDYKGRCTIFHEVLHMALSALDYSTDHIIEQLPENLRGVETNVIERERESLVSTISRASVRWIYSEEKSDH